MNYLSPSTFKPETLKKNTLRLRHQPLGQLIGVYINNCYLVSTEIQDVFYHHTIMTNNIIFNIIKIKQNNILFHQHISHMNIIIINHYLVAD